MAVSALPRTRERVPPRAATLPPALLGLTLIAPALDLLGAVQPAAAVPNLGLLATALTSAALLFTWGRFWRTSWLAGASLAGVASLAMRLAGADVAPALSLLAVVALGIGGAFGPSALEVETWLV